MSARTLGNGRYVLSDRPLGAGGMGTVWKAFDSVLHREVAVKEVRIPDGLGAEEQELLRTRALREARAAAGLDHPAIVTIHDVVDEGGRPWIVMRLLPGQTLDHVVRANGPLSPRRAAELGVRLVEALGTAHANGVLHRDVKPQNVMLGGDDRWMLTDFGIASVAGATRTLTGTGVVTGTLGYVAPERLSGGEFGPPADLWALGATLYFAVEGQHAYDFDDLPAMIAAVLTRDPRPSRQAGPLAPIIAGLMARDPAQRLDAGTARQQLLAVAGGYPTFENPGLAEHPTERIRSGTKVLPTEPGTPPFAGGAGSDLGAGGVGLGGGGDAGASSGAALRGSAVVTGVLNGALGACLVLLVGSLSQGMPVWIAGAVLGAAGAGAGLGALLAPSLGRWLGVPAALVGSALVGGEAVIGAGVLVEPDRPIATVILFGVALIAFAAWHRLSKTARRRLVPGQRLGRVNAIHRAAGFGGFVVGAAAGGAFIWLIEVGHHTIPIIGLLVSVGALIVIAALSTIPAVRSMGTPPVRRALPATTSLALVIPVLVGTQAGVYYVQGRDDFTAVPEVCSVSTLSQSRIARLQSDPPEADTYEGSKYARCTWEWTEKIGEFEVYVRRYDNARDASRRLQSERKLAEKDGLRITELTTGDEGIVHPYDSYLNSMDTLGVEADVRIDNLVLQVSWERSDARGRPDAAQVLSIATELSRQLEAQRPPA